MLPRVKLTFFGGNGIRWYIAFTRVHYTCNLVFTGVRDDNLFIWLSLIKLLQLQFNKE